MAAQVGVSQQVLPLEYLIGGPLQAIVKAHALASQSTLQFISDVGFEPEKTGETTPKARIFEFSYIHPVPDPKNPGAVLDTPTNVKVPVLAMVSPPSLKISEVTIDFSTRVLGFSESKVQQTELRHLKSQPQTESLPFQILATYATRPAQQPSAQGEPHTFSISMKVTSTDVPEAAKRVMGLLQDAIITHPVKEERVKSG